MPRACSLRQLETLYLGEAVRVRSRHRSRNNERTNTTSRRFTTMSVSSLASSDGFESDDTAVDAMPLYHTAQLRAVNRVLSENSPKTWRRRQPPVLHMNKVHLDFGLVSVSRNATPSKTRALLTHSLRRRAAAPRCKWHCWTRSSLSTLAIAACV